MYCVYPGSFDPITKGHLDIIHRASLAFDKVFVTILVNHKKSYLFSVAERIEMIEKACVEIPNVEACFYDGLLINFAKEKDIQTIIRGLRSASDFEFELQMANLNKQLAPQIETYFMATSPELSYISSTAVKELAMFHADISKYVPASILQNIKEKFEGDQHEQ